MTIEISKYILTADHNEIMEACFIYEDEELFFMPLEDDNTEADYDVDAYAKAYAEAEAEAIAQLAQAMEEAEEDARYWTTDSIWSLGLHDMF